MKNWYKLFIASIGLFCTVHTWAQTITGNVKDKTTGEPLFSVTVLIEGTTRGAVTDFEGNFTLEADTVPPFNLQITYLGYETQTIPVTQANIGQPINVKLAQSTVLTEIVEVTDIRITEKQKESPLTVESMGISAIKETPAANFYEGLGQLKGVDLTSASIGFKVINTRGFNSTSPVRSLQIIDGVDNQAPGLNFSLGNFLGASELDVQKVDLIVGASSAFYGPNAFNGVISMTTKDPFMHKGLSVSLKGGERALFEGAVRWAQPFKNKADREFFAYKLNFFYLRANDWEARNIAPVEGTQESFGNPGGHDAVNRYGDETLFSATSNQEIFRFPGLRNWYRTGYMEEDIVDYNTENIKANIALHFRTKKEVEFIVSSNFGNGTTVYQGDNRYSLKNILFFQNRFEIRKENKFFVRLYATHENAGDSYDAVFTAIKLQDAVKSDNDWSTAYRNYWANNIVNQVKSLEGYPPDPSIGQPFNLDQANAIIEANYDSILAWHIESRMSADSNRLVPGTPEFDSLLNSITSKEVYAEGGTKFYDKSALYHAQAEYKFTPTWLDITLGGNFRLYTPNSRGTIFKDTAGITITNYEFGFYLGFEKRLAEDKVKINATARLDKNQNFPVLVSPAASIVYTPTKDHILRFSFSAAIRNPTLQDQYLYYNVGRAILIGNLDGFDSLVTIESLREVYGGQAIDYSKLDYFDVDPVVPEKVRTLEAGYRTTLFNKVYVDMGYYFSFYKDFIGYNLGAVAPKNYITDSTFIIDQSEIQPYRVASNATSRVTTQGFSIGINYFFYKYLSLNGNYSWNVLNKEGADDPLIPAFNTPAHKFNIGIAGKDIVFKAGKAGLKDWGFNVNCKWVQSFVFEGSPQFTGRVPSFWLLDAQINKVVPKIYTTFKLGASNLLNYEHIEVYGGPVIGRMIYGSITFEFNKI